MDTIEFIRQLVAVVRRQTDEVMKELTVDQLNCTPLGSANPISAIFVHFLYSEEAFVQTLKQGKPKLWAEKTGVAVLPSYSSGWEEVNSKNAPV